MSKGKSKWYINIYRKDYDIEYDILYYSPINEKELHLVDVSYGSFVSLREANSAITEIADYVYRVSHKRSSRKITYRAVIENHLPRKFQPSDSDWLLK